MAIVGDPEAHRVGFFYWAGISHFLNLLLVLFLVRSGIEILSACPKLYLNDDCRPGSEWLKFTHKKLPDDRVWISLEEEEDFSPWIALPGHKKLGLGRLWHFFGAFFWIINGIVYMTLLFLSGEWSRLVPTSWALVPGAWETLLTYLRFQLPPHGHPYNPLQQLSYFAVIFLVGPFMIATGLAMSPAIAGRFPWYLKLFGNRQTARSLHFCGLAVLCAFVVVHVGTTLIEGFAGNVDWIIHGSRSGARSLALGVFAGELVLAFGIQLVVTRLSLRHPRGVQRALSSLVDPMRKLLLHRLASVQEYPDSKISPYFRVNGFPPTTPEYLALEKTAWRDWRLEVQGLVSTPLSLSLDDLRAMPRRTQTTKHHCIQGWSAVAKWTGIPVSEILERCKPLPGAHWIVFHGYDVDAEGRAYYEALELDLMDHRQTILAVDMNDKPLPVEHGAPCRLRVESVLGFKMVKYLKTIELLSDYATIGQGQGGYREDDRFYGAYAGL